MRTYLAKPITVAALLSLAFTAQAQESDPLLTATHSKLNEVVREALTADAEVLKKWSKEGPQDKAAKKEFCPDYEWRYLAGFHSALADSKQQTGEKAREARAQAAWMVYLLASFRPATKEDLKQLLLEAKIGAPPGSATDDAAKWDFPTQVRIEKSLAQLEQPLPGRVRISQAASECFLAAKVQPRYPEAAKSHFIQGDVELKVVVDRDGWVVEVTPLSGEGVLVAASTEAVAQWRYRPYHLTGQPVEFETQVTVKYTLSRGW